MFIALDGPDGSGKTTQVQRLAEKFREAGRDVICPREPGGTKIGEAIRELLLLKTEIPMNATTEAFLFSACRAQLYGDVIKPALKKDSVVLMDRSFWSTVVYQGRDLSLAKIFSMIEAATFGIHPDICMFLDISAETSIARSKARQGERFKGLGIVEDIVTSYRRVAKKYGVLLISSEGPVDQVTQTLWNLIELTKTF